MFGYHPWRHFRAQSRWVVEWADLPEGRLGQTDFKRGTVTLDKGLTQVERRCTIAHELVHIERGPVPRDPRLRAREEKAVEQIAARRLIDLHALGEALAWSRHNVEIADELWVDEPTLRARLASLTDEERTYLDARLAFMDWH